MRHPFMDSRLRGHIPQHWPTSCTILIPLVLPSESNQPELTGAYSEVDGMVDIPCIFGPVSGIRVTDLEERNSNIQSTVEKRTCKLNGYFPTIQVRGNVARVNGEIWQIRGVEHDYLKFSTRLSLEQVSP